MMRPPTIIINVCSGVLIARRHANYVLISRGSVTQRPSCYNNVINGPHYIWCVDTLIQPSHHQPPGPLSKTLGIVLLLTFKGECESTPHPLSEKNHHH